MDLSFFQGLMQQPKNNQEVPLFHHNNSEKQPNGMVDRFKEGPLQEEQDNLLRLQYDFEFLQHLLAPDYIKFLSKQGYFRDAEFLNYLEYL